MDLSQIVHAEDREPNQPPVTEASASQATPSSTIPAETPGDPSTSIGNAMHSKQQDKPSSTSSTAQTGPTEVEAGEGAPPMSKNALKRLRKAQKWENEKEDRRKRRKEKHHAAKVRQREHRKELLAQGVDRSLVFPNRKDKPSTLVPVALVIDCDFESYMTDKERISMSSQVTRAYSDNRNARYKAHLWIAGWGGKLRERYETTMENQHKNWHGVGFCEGDFVETALKAEEVMRNGGGGDGVGAQQMIPILQRSLDEEIVWKRDETDPFPLPDPEPEPREEYKNMVYLTSESPYTLERLEPNTCYIVGGIVDKNREKGLCYKRARERGIRTARLPIGQFMVMQSRFILATNHVVDIMLKWLEFEDWGQAFTAVIPKRKGGVLRGQENADAAAGDNASNEPADEEKAGGGADDGQGTAAGGGEALGQSDDM